MPIIIIEGCDKTGKSSLARMLCGMTRAQMIKVSQPQTADAIGEYEAAMLALQRAEGHPSLIVFDRFHLGEFVYGPIFRGAKPNPFRAGRLEDHLADMGAVVVMMEDDHDAIVARFIEHGEAFAQASRVAAILAAYEQVYEWCTLPKMRARWSMDPLANAMLANEVLQFAGWKITGLT